ncbi:MULTISPECIES: AraC family transcriptional regulator [unclassified Paenibacillus]|uniref:helix-turn-helix transcriptional regulator n=1 Tax=unclassified Paenibacillus TaxID=185978 RepID=UPI00041B5B3F|nr:MULTISPECIES: AraC family transcriptional regulator [unclassified Paenibacillus]
MEMNREHWENNPLDRSYPFKLFFNASGETKPGQCVLFLHWHEHFEFIVMRRGRAVFHIGSQVCEAEPGTLLVVQAGDLHTGFSRGSEQVEYVSIVFNGALFSDWAKEEDYDTLLSPYLDGRASLPAYPGRCGEEARRLIDMAVAESGTGFSASGRMIAKTYLFLAFAWLARTHLPPGQAGRAREAGFRQERFKELIRHVEDSGAPMGVREAARMVSVSPHHFCKMFKRLTGRTFTDFVNRCRMRQAAKLLLETGLSVTEVAERVGCSNPNYFTRLFKQYVGMTPSQARNRALPDRTQAGGTDW